MIQEQPLLRIHHQRLGGRNDEGTVVEQLGSTHKTPMATASSDRPLRAGGNVASDDTAARPTIVWATIRISMRKLLTRK